MSVKSEEAYKAWKAERIDAMMENPRCAIVSLVRYCAERGYRLELRTGEESVDELCPATTDPRAVLTAVWEIDAEAFAIIDAEGDSDGRWAYLMWPGTGNCSPDESVVDHGVCPLIDAWAEEFYA